MIPPSHVRRPSARCARSWKLGAGRRKDSQADSPLIVSANSVRFALRELVVANLALEGVVRIGRAPLPGVVGNLMIVPDSHPGESAVKLLKIRIEPVGTVAAAEEVSALFRGFCDNSDPLAVVLQRRDLAVGLGNSAEGGSVTIVAILVLVDVVCVVMDKLDERSVKEKDPPRRARGRRETYRQGAAQSPTSPNGWQRYRTR